MDTRVRIPDDRIPMSERAYRDVESRLRTVAARIEQLEPEATAHAIDGLVHGEFFLAQREHEALAATLLRARLSEDPSAVAVGSEVRYRDAGDPAPLRVTIVHPGDADPAVGRVSLRSPLGAALLGRRVGDSVDVDTPAGRRRVTIDGLA